MAASRRRTPAPSPPTLAPIVYEYKSTMGSINTDSYWDKYSQSHISESVDDPVEPDGDGWELVGMAAAGDSTLVWCWRRPRAKQGP